MPRSSCLAAGKQRATRPACTGPLLQQGCATSLPAAPQHSAALQSAGPVARVLTSGEFREDEAPNWGRYFPSLCVY